MVRDSQGIIEPVLVLIKGSKFGLGYIPTDDNMKVKKKNDQPLTKPIPHRYQSFPVREYAEHETLGKEYVNSSRRSMLLSRKMSI